MEPQLVIRSARLPDRDGLWDVAIAGGRIARIAPKAEGTAPHEVRAGGRLLIPGLVDSHFHLDKALLSARTPSREGTLQEALRITGEAKRAFTVEDIAARARRALEMAIRHGTTAMRTHVEVDPIVGLKGMEAILPLQREYAWAIDLQICVFPQEGIFQAPGTDQLMRRALQMGEEHAAVPEIGVHPDLGESYAAQTGVFEFANQHGREFSQNHLRHALRTPCLGHRSASLKWRNVGSKAGFAHCAPLKPRRAQYFVISRSSSPSDARVRISSSWAAKKRLRVPLSCGTARRRKKLSSRSSALLSA